MIGRRIYPDAAGELCCYLAEGDYGRDGRGVWFAQPPGAPWIANLGEHTVVEHDDQTITVSPSIRVEQPGLEPPFWHGFLEAGVWRIAS